MPMAEQIYDLIKTLPANQLMEVFDFINSIQSKTEATHTSAMSKEQEIIAGILARRNQRKSVATDYLQQLRMEVRSYH